MKNFLFSFLFISSSVFAAQPEFFFQPEDSKGAAQLFYGYNHLDAEGKFGTTLQGNQILLGGYVDYGWSESIALRLGISFYKVDLELGSQPFPFSC